MLDPSEARVWAETVGRLMADIETQLILIIRNHVARDMGAPTYTVKRLAEVATVRARLEQELGRSWEKVITQVQQVLNDARDAGQGMATRDLAHAGLPDRLPPQMAIGIEAIAADTMLHLTGMPAVILRDTVDAYQQIMAAPASMVTSGALTRVQATQVALTRYAKHGIDGFTDRGGRRWRIDSYAEMATRTGALHSLRYGYEQTLTRMGEDLVMVDSHGYTCSKCGPWEGKVISLTGMTPTGWNTAEHATRDGVMVSFQVAGTLTEAREAGLFHPNCFPGSVLVEAPTGVHASDARWYEGDVIVIQTASGDELTVTPNHPVLTSEGWVPAGLLREGMDVVRYDRWNDVGLVDGPDQVHVPTPIGDVHRALRESGTVTTVHVPVTAHQFHGDGVPNTEVEVVLTNRLLEDHGFAHAAQESGDGSFLSGGVGLSALLPAGPPFEVVLGSDHASDGLVSVSDLGGPLLGGHGLPAAARDVSGVGPVAASQQDAAHSRLGDTNSPSDLGLCDACQMKLDRLISPRGSGVFGGLGGFLGGTDDAAGAEPRVDGGLADAESGSELLGRLSGQVSLAQVVHVDRRDFHGHVYNLATQDHWYVASSIVVHNCGHGMAMWLPGISTPAEPGRDQQTYDASQQQRALERDIRMHKRELAAALTPEAATEARRAIRANQARIRDLIEAHPKLTRKSVREQIRTAH